MQGLHHSAPPSLSLSFPITGWRPGLQSATIQSSKSEGIRQIPRAIAPEREQSLIKEPPRNNAQAQDAADG